MLNITELVTNGPLGAALPLLSFNLWVETGQLAIAVVVLRFFIWKFRNRPIFLARFAPICSTLISIAGGFWLVELVR